MIVQMEQEELLCMLELLHADGKWLLPERTLGQPMSAEAFLKVREKWQQEGLIVLDFDGEIHPTTEFARLTYNIRKVCASMRYDCGEETEIYVKGPLDMTWLHREGGNWKLQLSTPSKVGAWCTGELEKRKRGVLTVCRYENGEFQKKEVNLEACREIKKILEEQINCYYKEDAACLKL